MAPAVAIRWSSYVFQRPPVSLLGSILIPSDSSVAFPPIEVISPTSAAKRSVSCPRRCEMPVSSEGVAARAAIAAMVGTHSPASERSALMPRIFPVPRTLSCLFLYSTSPPISVSNLLN